MPAPFFWRKEVKSVLTFLMVLSLATSANADENVLMRHGNTVITTETFNAALADWLPEQQRGSVLASEKKVRDLLAKMFIQYKLADEATERGLNNAEKARYNHQMRRALSNIQIEHLAGKVNVDNIEQQAREQYQKNESLYMAPEMVRVEHILISSTTRPKEEARQIADKVFALAKSGDVEFKKLVAGYSDDPSAKGNNGDLGFFGKGKMVKTFEDAAFALKAENELVGPIETGFGFHIIRLLEKKAAQVRPFEEVSSGIIAEINSKARNEMLRAEYDRIGKLPNLEIDQEAIKALVVNPFNKAKVDQVSPAKTPAQ